MIALIVTGLSKIPGAPRDAGGWGQEGAAGHSAALLRLPGAGL